MGRDGSTAGFLGGVSNMKPPPMGGGGGGRATPGGGGGGGGGGGPFEGSVQFRDADKHGGGGGGGGRLFVLFCVAWCGCSVRCSTASGGRISCDTEEGVVSFA